MGAAQHLTVSHSRLNDLVVWSRSSNCSAGAVAGVFSSSKTDEYTVTSSDSTVAFALHGSASAGQWHTCIQPAGGVWTLVTGLQLEVMFPLFSPLVGIAGSITPLSFRPSVSLTSVSSDYFSLTFDTNDGNTTVAPALSSSNTRALFPVSGASPNTTDLRSLVSIITFTFNQEIELCSQCNIGALEILENGTLWARINSNSSNQLSVEGSILTITVMRALNEHSLYVVNVPSGALITANASVLSLLVTVYSSVLLLLNAPATAPALQLLLRLHTTKSLSLE